MTSDARWKALGWRHPVWTLLRFYLSLRSDLKKNEWLTELWNNKFASVDCGITQFPVDSMHITILNEYLFHRERAYDQAAALLRTEEEALKYCKAKGIDVHTTATKTQEHHQSSKAMVAAVSAVARRTCNRNGFSVESNPQSRCVWCVTKGLHVSARNVDGAIPSLANPIIIWEIKEYWGKTKGGSKMSDAVYECNLVGRELREFEEAAGFSVAHVVFLDGKKQWAERKSDLLRFIDLLNQGLIDQLHIGKDVETRWEFELTAMLTAATKDIR